EAVGTAAAVRAAGVAVRNEQVDVAVVVAVAGRCAADRHIQDLRGEQTFQVSPDEGRSREADLVGDVRGGRHVEERRGRGSGASASAAIAVAGGQAYAKGQCR